MNEEIEKSIKLRVNSRFFDKKYDEIIDNCNIENNQNLLKALKANPFKFKTYLDLTNCDDLMCDKCEACMFALFLKNKNALKSRNKNTWKQANDNNKNYFRRLKLYHCHLINILEYNSSNVKTKPIYKELNSGVTSGLYIIYKEKKNALNTYICEILFVCKHPNSKQEWDSFKQELAKIEKLKGS